MTDYEKLYRCDRDVCGRPFPEFEAFFDRSRKTLLSVLDLGCGQGRDSLMIARKGHSVLGVDLSPTGIAQMCEAAATEHLPVTGLVADLLSYQPDQTFDVVVLDRTLHMFPGFDDREHVLYMAAGCVVPGGDLLIADVPSNKQQITEFFGAHANEWRFDLSNKNFTFVQRL